MLTRESPRGLVVEEKMIFDEVEIDNRAGTIARYARE